MTRESAPFGRAAPGHRLPEGTALGPVRLQVASLGRSLPYYRDVLGLTVLEREEGVARLGPAAGADGGAPTLVELRAREGAAPVPRHGRLGLYHYALLLPDRGSLGRFSRHLGRLGIRPGAAHHLVSEALYLSDPDGLGIEVYADVPRELWKREGDGQLRMDTRRLDLDDLEAAGGDAAWKGMPAGSVVGHVHLHVDDLEAASAFYHEGLGLDRTVWSYPGALFLSAGGYHHHLGLNTWASHARPAGPDDARLLEWEIRVPSRVDAGRALEGLGASGYEVETADGGGVATDPWGVRLRIVEAG